MDDKLIGVVAETPQLANNGLKIIFMRFYVTFLQSVVGMQSCQQATVTAISALLFLLTVYSFYGYVHTILEQNKLN